MENLQHRYAQLRKAAQQRLSRLEKAGFNQSTTFSKVRDLSPSDFEREIKRIERWLSNDKNTVKGQRQRAERIREQAREYRRRKAEKEGRQYNPRPPKQDEEERRRRKNEYQREWRKRRKEELENFTTGDKKADQALKNLQSGLKKHGIEVRCLKELKAWGQYIKERKADSDRDWYAFMNFLKDAAGEEMPGEKRHVSADDIYQMIEDFNQWKADQAGMEQAFKETKADQIKFENVRGLWDMYFNSRKK